MGSHNPWGLQSPVGRRLCSSVAHLDRRGVGVNRGLLLLLLLLVVLCGCLSVTLHTVFIRNPQRGWIYLDQTTSRSHAVEHMNT